MCKEAIVHVLDDLMGSDDILACMVVDRGMDHVMPSYEKFDVGANKVRDDLKQTCHNIFRMIDCYSEARLEEMKWTLKHCKVWFYVFPDFRSALMAVVPLSSDDELVKVGLERAGQRILRIKKKKRGV